MDAINSNQPKQPQADRNEPESLRETLQQPVDQLTHMGREKASQVVDQVREGVNAQLQQQKDRVADTLGAVAGTLHEACHKLSESGHSGVGSYIHQGHQTLERASDYLRSKPLDDIAQDVTTYARRNPTTFVTGLFAVGFLAGRFFRSSTPQTTRALVPYTGPRA